MSMNKIDRLCGHHMRIANNHPLCESTKQTGLCERRPNHHFTHAHSSIALLLRGTVDQQIHCADVETKVVITSRSALSAPLVDGVVNRDDGLRA